MAVLGRGRHSRGSADPVGSIWCQYRPKRSHDDPFRTIFDVFGPRIGVPSPARTPLGALKGPQGPLRAPWAPQGAGISKPCCYGAALPRRGVFFRPKIDLSQKSMPKMVKKKLRLRGWDPPGEIRAEILCRMAPEMPKMTIWRPDWGQKGCSGGPLGFRGQLAHPWDPQGAPRASKP